MVVLEEEEEEEDMERARPRQSARGSLFGDALQDIFCAVAEQFPKTSGHTMCADRCVGYVLDR